MACRFYRHATGQRQSGLNRVKASVFRRWPESLGLYPKSKPPVITGGFDFGDSSRAGGEAGRVSKKRIPPGRSPPAVRGHAKLIQGYARAATDFVDGMGPCPRRMGWLTAAVRFVAGRRASPRSCGRCARGSRARWSARSPPASASRPRRCFPRARSAAARSGRPRPDRSR